MNKEEIINNIGKREIEFKFVLKDRKSDKYFISQIFRLDEIIELDNDSIMGSIEDFLCGDTNSCNCINEGQNFCECNLLEDFEIVTKLQYTGRKDPNGTKIFHGDIVRGISCYSDRLFIIEYSQDNCAFSISDRWCNGDAIPVYIDWNDIEVIGNVFENDDILI